MNTAKDLTKEPPRSPLERLGNYAIFARSIDKCRALLWGNVGDFHYDCPLDRMLFSFKGVDGERLKQQVESGADDEALVEWLNANGVGKTPEEVAQWSDSMEKVSMYDDPEKRDWFVEQCKPLGLDPEKTTLFEWLDADDRATFGK